MSAPGDPRRPAAFLDRDGTIIRDMVYLNDPSQVELLPGAAEALRRLSAAGIPLVVVTSQSGIGRGLITQDQYDRVRMRLDDVLAAEGVRLLGTYMCPHHPDFDGPCPCRKPGTLLYRQAADEHRLDPARSWFIGDRWRDAAPAFEFGARGIVIPSDVTTPDDLARAEADPRLLVTQSLGTAADVVLADWADLP